MSAPCQSIQDPGRAGLVSGRSVAWSSSPKAVHPAFLQMLACLHAFVGVELSNSFFFSSCIRLIVITGGLIVNSTMKPVK
uniref:Uncharacterized protein n=1 Tax=Cyanoderma ruficeps TaxID=181631 RepID=A0A8C3REV9_9PASS